MFKFLKDFFSAKVKNEVSFMSKIDGKDVMIISEDDTLIGGEVLFIDENGEKTLVEDGDYILDDKLKISILEGKITYTEFLEDESAGEEVSEEEVLDETIIENEVDEVLNETDKKEEEEVLDETDTKKEKEEILDETDKKKVEEVLDEEKILKIIENNPSIREKLEKKIVYNSKEDKKSEKTQKSSQKQIINNTKQNFMTKNEQNLLGVTNRILAEKNFKTTNGVLDVNLNLEYNGVNNTQYAFYEPIINSTDIKSLFKVITDVRVAMQYPVISAPNGRISKSGSACNVTNPTQVPITTKKVDVKPFSINLEQCIEVLESTIFAEYTKNGYDATNLSGTELEKMVLMQIQEALKRDIMYDLSFGDSSVDANSFDGLWTRMFAGEGTDVVKVDDMTTTLSASNPTSNAEYFIRRLVERAPLGLKQIIPSRKAIYVTDNVHDNYLTMLEQKVASEGYMALIDGVQVPTFRGIKIQKVSEWSAILGGVYGASPLTNINALMLYTTPENHYAAMDIAYPATNLKFFYDPNAEVNRIKGHYRLGYNYAGPKLQAISYGDVNG